jgi:ATP-dependent Clp protease ATP-binding subunit ClpA
VVAKIEEQTHVAISTPGGAEKDLLLHLEEKLHERVIGQDDAVNAISTAVRRVRSGLTTQTRPISFLFLGPTGVGKTETAKALAQIYFGGEDKTIRLDMSEYTGFGSINRLLGASAGEGIEKGELTEKVYERPFSLILLDEFEKANTEVLDLFLQVFEDGRLTDNHGKLVSFANTIIIATSNAGALYIQDRLNKGDQVDGSFQQGLVADLEQEHIFKPELLNRFDGIIVFKPLSDEDTKKIVKLFLNAVSKKLKEQDINIIFDESVILEVSKMGIDSQFGARPLRRFIQDKIEDPISKEMLEGTIVRGTSLTASFDQNGNLLLK